MSAPATQTTAPPPAARDLPPSALVLIGANLIPLIGVLAFGWTVFSILLLYWAENVVIGMFNVLRMAFAQPRNVGANVGKVLLIPFFTFHYGMFTLVHGLFVVALFGPGARGLSPARLVDAVRQAGIGWGLLAIAASHAFSFLHNYLASGEYRNAALNVIMFQPYARVMILHVTILAGGFLAQQLGAPAAVLLVLVVLKTAMDVRAHLAERRKLGAMA